MTKIDEKKKQVAVITSHMYDVFEKTEQLAKSLVKEGLSLNAVADVLIGIRRRKEDEIRFNHFDVIVIVVVNPIKDENGNVTHIYFHIDILDSYSEVNYEMRKCLNLYV